MKLKIIVSALFIMSFLTPFVVKADTVYFAQPVFSGVSGKVFSDVATGNVLGIYSYGVGDITNSFGGWAISDFTGFNVGAPLSTYQSGAASGVNTYGSTSVQMKGEYVGVMLNGFTGPANTAIKNIGYGRAGTNLYPWSSSLGGDPNVCISFDLSVPQYYTEGAALYIVASLYLIDKVTDKRFSLLITAWDNREVVTTEGYVGYDSNTYSYMYGTYFGSGSNFVTKRSASSNSLTGTVPSLNWMSACVSRSNVVNLINDANSSTHGFGFSTNPDNYLLESYGVQTESGEIGGKKGMGRC